MIPATACILIGGESSRFGSPKWRAMIGGTTILDRLWMECERFEHRYVIGKEKPQGLDKPFVSDTLDIKAPINGLHTSLENAETDWILLLSCDLPLITKDILVDLWDQTDSKKNIIVPKVRERLEPTCALYHKRILDLCNTRIEKNKLGLQALIRSIKSHSVDLTERSDQFMNMNTKSDMSDAEKTLRSQTSVRLLS
jgi:molybdopterin-guanine dinucleotide biosynthesis protein A